MNWQERIKAHMDQYKGNIWSPDAPQSKYGYQLLAENENLACALCQNFVKVFVIEDGHIRVNTVGSFDIGCDFEATHNSYRKVSIIPDASAQGGARVSQSSENGCRRDLLGR